MIEIEKNIHVIRLDLMSWILDTPPDSYGSYKDWLQLLRTKVNTEGQFSEDCCKDCNEQRMVDLFMLRFRHSPDIFTALLNSSKEGRPNILDLHLLCDKIDRGEFTVVKEEAEENLTEEEKHGIVRSLNSTTNSTIGNEEEKQMLGKSLNCTSSTIGNESNDENPKIGKRRSLNSTIGNNVKRRRKGNQINLSDDDILKLAEETGRGIGYLSLRKRAGVHAEYPIYYPDYPDVPRYWTVDDFFAFEELLDAVPEEENPFKRAKKIQGLIQNGEYIPLSAVRQRLSMRGGSGNWKGHEIKQFLALTAQHKASDYETAKERALDIFEKMDTKRTKESIAKFLSNYEMCMESVRKPVLLPKYTEEQIGGFENSEMQVEIKDENMNDLDITEKSLNSTTSSIRNVSKRRQRADKINISDDEIEKLAEETGRSPKFLNKRKKAGLPAEFPIYYPDHPEIPRYWTVDDTFAFEELLEMIPEEENPFKRARKIQGLIGNGESIPANVIRHRQIQRANKSNWQSHEIKQFVAHATKHTASDYETATERANAIIEAMESSRPRDSVLKYLSNYEMCMESIRKPVVLPKYTEAQINGSRILEMPIVKKEESMNETDIDQNDFSEGASKASFKSNLVTEDIAKLAEETGRSTYFLTQRESVGKLAEDPIYYPDYPDVPRYWRVDDIWAFSELLETVPEEESTLKRARKIQSKIGNGDSIPVLAIHRRVKAVGARGSWTSEENRRFIELTIKYDSNDFSTVVERVQLIQEELGSTKSRKIIDHRLRTFEMCLESIRKPLVLPKFGSGVENITIKCEVNASFDNENNNETKEDIEVSKTKDVPETETKPNEETQFKIRIRRKPSDAMEELCARTGRSIAFLQKRQRVGKFAEKPIYYPDHPKVPRYWTVDDSWAFDELAEKLSKEENIYKVARKIKILIRNSETIPITSIKSRITKTGLQWSLAERKKFLELLEKHPKSNYDSISERVAAIHEEMKHKTKGALLTHLNRYEMSLESIRNPLVLPNFDGSSLES